MQAHQLMSHRTEGKFNNTTTDTQSTRGMGAVSVPYPRLAWVKDVKRQRTDLHRQPLQYI